MIILYSRLDILESTAVIVIMWRAGKALHVSVLIVDTIYIYNYD